MSAKFVVRITQPIAHPRINIQTGDELLIDKGIPAKAGDLFLCGSRVDFWDSIKNIQGVVTKVMRNC